MIIICYYVTKYVRKNKKIDESHQTLFCVRVENIELWPEVIMPK